jgi:hypothetical protein
MRVTARNLERIAHQIGKLDDTRKTLISAYAKGRTSNAQYVERNRSIDRVLQDLARVRVELDNAAIRRNGLTECRVDEFCERAKAAFKSCTDLETQRRFLKSHIKEIIFTRGRISIVGSVQAQDAVGSLELPFRIEGRIDGTRTRNYATRRMKSPIMVPEVKTIEQGFGWRDLT